MSDDLNKKRLFSLFENMKNVKPAATNPVAAGSSSEEKKKLFSLFDEIKGEHASIQNAPTKDRNSDVLIVDFLNLFIRSHMVNPAMNENGNHVGAIFGSLKSLGYAIRMLRPTRCIIISDGVGGSLRRRKIYPDYKCKRKTRIRVNRMYSDLSTPDLEDKSIKWQMARLIEYFNILPVTVFSIDSIEADDAIATLTTDVFNKEYQKVNIMSADKDFLQLVNDKVSVWSPTKKRLYGPKEVLDDYGISSKNFIYYRILDGDESDNIDGVRGAGLKTIRKVYPFLTEETESSVEQILAYAEDNRNKFKIHESVCGGQQLLHRNYELMQLKNVNIADSNKLRIKELTDVPTTKLNKLQFIKMFNEDKAYSVMPDYNTWLTQTFQTLNYYT